MTDERFNPETAAGARSPWWGVHVSRYRFAAEHVRGRRMLDIACGTGYGLTFLRGEGRLVIGADADHAAAVQARNGRGGTLPVLLADGARLPFARESFDSVTSFETLEHLVERDAFLDELRRVLAPAGVLILSTPNAQYTQPVSGKPKNPFHVHEYTPGELRRALDGRFHSVKLLGQSLHPRIAISPFWDDQQRLPRTPAAQARLLAWRVMNRLPDGVRDAASRALWGHQFVPADTDYVFGDVDENVPVLVAICTAPRSV